MGMKRYCLYITISALPVIGADDGQYKVRFGIGTFISNPTGSLNSSFTSSSGLGGSIFLIHQIGKGFDYLFDVSCDADYSDKLVASSDGNAVKVKLSSYGTALACTYHINKQQDGFYILAGLGARRFQGIAEFPAGSQSPLPKSGFGGNTMPTYLACDTGIKLAYAAGVGYDFNKRWGALIRYQGITSLGHTLATVESGINFYF